jgi:hypothetical protein
MEAEYRKREREREREREEREREREFKSDAVGSLEVSSARGSR